jgi:EAL domain-containing protein (putative c-di-GMP-specific phosphodiesterase class I)/GGDEF domain-containing protein
MAENTEEPRSVRNREHSKQLLMRYLDLGTLSNENSKLRDLLYDEVTKLPTVSLLLNNIRTMLDKHKQIGVIYVDIDTDSRFEQTFGYHAMEEVMNHVSKALSQLKGEAFRNTDAVSTVVKSGNDFVILLAPPRELPRLELDDLFKIRKRILKGLRDKMNQNLDQAVSKQFHCRAGAAIIEDDPTVNVEHLVYNALEAAKESAELRELEKQQKQVERLQLAISQQEISTLFQPIVEFSSLKPLGFEAYSRGPSPDMEYPELLFRVATEGDLVWKLDRCCRDRAFMNAKGMPAELLFVNVDPHAVGDPDLKNMADSLYLKHSELSLNRVVFDLSARAVLTDFDLFRLTVNYFQSLGFKISLDDNGGGHYAGLEIIARTKPDFVKIDIPLVRGIEKDEINQDLVATIVKFSHKAGSIVIAEGIETEAELKKLTKLGVEIGQGYLFAAPGEPFPSVTPR